MPDITPLPNVVFSVIVQNRPDGTWFIATVDGRYEAISETLEEAIVTLRSSLPADVAPTAILTLG